MLRLLADENFNDDIVRGVLRRKPDLDIIRLRDTGLTGAIDPDNLEWCARNNRILLTHDRASMSDHAYKRVAAGDALTGVFIFKDRLPIQRVIEEILLLDACSEQEDWQGRAVNMPL